MATFTPVFPVLTVVRKRTALAGEAGRESGRGPQNAEMPPPPPCVWHELSRLVSLVLVPSRKERNFEQLKRGSFFEMYLKYFQALSNFSI